MNATEPKWKENVSINETRGSDNRDIDFCRRAVIAVSDTLVITLS